MEQNLRFGLVLGRLAVLKIAQTKQLVATFDGNFLMLLIIMAKRMLIFFF